MKIAISWPGFTGYMGACFRALARSCQLRLFIEPSRYEQRFSGKDLEGLDWERIEGEETIGRVVRELNEWQPDLLVVCGWSTPLSRALARAKIETRKVLAFDMPWEWSVRKILAPLILRPLLKNFDLAFVPGARCARYARWLGFGGGRLVLGSNPSGWEKFSPHVAQPQNRFLFVGRFSLEKGLDNLFVAYRTYRARTTSPWPLDLIGSGNDLPRKIPEGVNVAGFVEPSEMPRIVQEHACLVLPSLWEPWGVSAAEAMSAGLMTILSERCGLVDDIEPTIRVRARDAEGLAAALLRVTRFSETERACEAHRVQTLAERYSAANWAARVMGMGEKK